MLRQYKKGAKTYKRFRVHVVIANFGKLINKKKLAPKASKSIVSEFFRFFYYLLGSGNGVLFSSVGIEMFNSSIIIIIIIGNLLSINIIIQRHFYNCFFFTVLNRTQL